MQLINKYNKGICFLLIHFVFFSSNPALSSHLIKSDKLWKEREEVFLYKWFLKYITLHLKTQKNHNLQLLNQSVQSFSDTDAHVLISLAGKVVELLLFKSDNIALSEAQIACWICLH